MAIALIAAAAVLWLWRSSMPPTPRFLTKASGPISGALWSDGAWYWVENAMTPASRLVRCAGAAGTPIATAPGIGAFGVGDGKIAWTLGGGSQWSIQRANVDGSGAGAIWSGDLKPQSVCIADRRVLWLTAAPGLVPNSGPFAPLGARIRVMAVPLDGGTPVTVSEVTEPLPRAILGARNGTVYFSVSRAGLQSVTVLYRCPAAGGPSTRIATEIADQEALLSKDGMLYWTGASHEAAQPERATCVRRLGADGRIETLQDWMPVGGALYQGDRGVFYVGGGSGTPNTWIVGGPDPLPRRAPMPEGYSAVAVGGADMICEPTSARDVTLYRVSLP